MKKYVLFLIFNNLKMLMNINLLSLKSINKNKKNTFSCRKRKNK